MKIDVLYEDGNILVINKPFGLVVNRAESIKGETVQDWVEAQEWFEKIKKSKNQNNENSVYWQRSGICHRLDKETSGCLLIAKNPDSLRYYLGLFKGRKIEKKYKTLVHGRVEPREGEVVLPLKRSIIEREKWRVHYDGKKAVTLWQVDKYFYYLSENQQWKNCLTLLDIGLKTGRTHQIRVHMSFLGWPIFADEKYLNKKQSIIDRELISHHFLHSAYLGFVDEFGQKIEVTAPLTEDYQKVLDSLEETA